MNSRYQLTASGLKEHLGLSDSAIGETFNQAISLCQETIEQAPGPGRSGIALSLGSFGSTLDGAQEYTGNYPPPFEISSSLNDGQICAAGSEQAAIRALKEWHISRLQVYAQTPAWNRVEWLAFETVPLFSEIRAIRQALKTFEAEGHAKKVWLTCPFPDGRHPDLAGNGVQVSPREIIVAACADGIDMRRVDGIGVNCTHPRFIPKLASDLTDAFRDLAMEGVVKPSEIAFVLYPDGGKAYDGATRSWKGQALSAKEWAGALTAMVRDAEGAKTENEQRVWKEIVVGGCCNTTYEHIAELKRAIDMLYSHGDDAFPS